MVIWLDRMEDHVDIPIGDLLAESHTGLEPPNYMPSAKEAFVIFVQPMKSGLLQVKMQGHTVK